jgi:hypothetical protein
MGKVTGGALPGGEGGMLAGKFEVRQLLPVTSQT